MALLTENSCGCVTHIHTTRCQPLRWLSAQHKPKITECTFKSEVCHLCATSSTSQMVGRPLFRQTGSP